jgi:hypothetical protein
MAKYLSKGYDKANETAQASLSIAPLAYEKDFRLKANNPGEAVIVNVTTPVDRPEKIRTAYSEIADIYKNTGIDESVTAPSKKGVQILSQVTETWSLLDDSAADYRIDLPVSAHLVVKIPACEHIAESDVVELVGRAIGAIYDAETGNWRVSSLVRGALVPQGL